MANEVESVGQNTQDEMAEKEDEISKQGGLGVNLESFSSSGTSTGEDKEESSDGTEQQSQEIDENVQSASLDDTTLSSSTVEELATLINDTALLDASNTSVDISQNRALEAMADEAKADAIEAKEIADEARVAADAATVAAEELGTQEAQDAAKEAQEVAQKAQEVAEQLEEEAQTAEDITQEVVDANDPNNPDNPTDLNTPNTAPTIGDIVDQTVAEDSGLKFSFDAFDAQDDALDSYVVGTNGLAYIDDNGQIVFNPDADYNGPASVTLVVSDGNGGVVTKVVNVTVDAVNDTPTIDTIVTQTVEQDGNKIISFNSSDIEGDALSSSATALNGTVVIDENGDISYSPNEGYTGGDVVTLTVDDGNGGVTSQSFSVTVTEDTTPPTVTMEDVIDLSSDDTPTISGTVDDDTESVSVEIQDVDGNVVDTVDAVLDGEGGWTVDSSSLADGDYTAVATATDDAGNTSTATENGFTVDTTADAGTVTPDAVTADDVISASESGETITVTGTATGGDIATGDTVTMEINGTTYTTEVEADGTYSVDVAGSDLAADTSFDVNVASTDAAGNTVTSSETSTHTVDTGPTVLLEESFENLQAGESDWDVVHGDVTGDHGAVWDTNENGVEIQTDGVVVDSSHGSNHIELDAHGPNSNVTMSTDVNLTDSSDYTVSFDVQPRELRGDADTSDMQVTFGDVTVAINSDSEGNLTFVTDDDSVVVRSELDSDTGWNTVVIEATGVTGDSATLTIEGTGADDTFGMLLDNIKVIDEVGHNNEIDEVETVGTDTETTITSDVDASSDTGVSDTDNLTNDNTPTVTGEGEVGATIVVTDASGNEVGTAVVGEDGTYSITTTELADGEQTLTVTSTDISGNSATSEQTVTIDTVSSDMNDLAITDIIDNDGNGTNITMTGTGAEAGNTITLIDEDGTEVATVEVQTDGTWSADI